jgi:hypothetical protein
MYSIHAISRAWSLRGPQTQLTDFFCQHTGAKDAADLLEGLARGRFHLGSSNAPVFFKAFHAGDPVARAGIEWISAELANLAIGVIRQLQFENLAFEVVLAGSFYNGTPLIEQLMRPAIREIAPGASLVRLDAPPVVGGIVRGYIKSCSHRCCAFNSLRSIRFREGDDPCGGQRQNHDNPQKRLIAAKAIINQSRANRGACPGDGQEDGHHAGNPPIMR